MVKKLKISKQSHLLSLKRIKRENIINKAPMVNCIDDIDKLVCFLTNNKACISESLLCEIILKKVNEFELREMLLKRIIIKRPEKRKSPSSRHQNIRHENLVDSQNNKLYKDDGITFYDEYRAITKIQQDYTKNECDNKIYENYDYGLSDW